MPELPEVETVCMWLRNIIIGAVIEKVDVLYPKLREPLDLKSFDRLQNSMIKTINRRSRYISIGLDNNLILLIHLGMTGNLLLNQTNTKKHDHVIFWLNGNRKITFNDQRKFGMLKVLSENEHKKILKKIGIEPFDPDFCTKKIQEIISKSKSNIKTILMNNKKIAGIGNIYACEILFDSCLLPTRSANSLSTAEIKKLGSSITKVLSKAIEAGGSSVRNYKNPANSTGYFQMQLKVYKKNGKRCSKCKDTDIVRIIQSSRSTFYCPICQK